MFTRYRSDCVKARRNLAESRRTRSGESGADRFATCTETLVNKRYQLPPTTLCEFPFVGISSEKIRINLTESSVFEFGRRVLGCRAQRTPPNATMPLNGRNSELTARRICPDQLHPRCSWLEKEKTASVFVAAIFLWPRGGGGELISTSLVHEVVHTGREKWPPRVELANDWSSVPENDGVALRCVKNEIRWESVNALKREKIFCERLLGNLV